LYSLAEERRHVEMYALVGRPCGPVRKRVEMPQLKERAGSRQFDVSADGQRFLINLPVGDEGPAPITLVQNWLAERKR